MILTIDNFRAISSAVLELANITLLSGKNGAGKSSILQALSVPLTGEVMPIRDEFGKSLPKKSAADLIHGAAKAATITLEHELGTATVTYPAGERTSEGAPFEASKMAAGVTSFVELKYPDRVLAINALLRSEPTYDDLLAALTPLRLPETAIKRLWGTISAQGWDAALDGAKRKGAELKGAWKQITHHTGQYGAQLAEAWLPEAWTEELRTATAEQLAADVADRKSWLEAAISESSVNDAEIARLKKITDLLPQMREQYEALELSQQLNRKNETDLIDGSERLHAEVEHPTNCPFCQNFVVIVGNRLKKPSYDPTDPNNDLQKRIAETDRALAQIQGVIKQRQSELDVRAGQIKDAEKSAELLATLTAKPADTGEGHGTVDDCRADLARAEARLSAWKAWHDATATHQTIQANQQIVDILAPDGLRISRLREALGVINARIAEITAAAGWDAVKIELDLSVWYGGRRYVEASDAQKFRARTAIQAAWATLDGSRMVLIDVDADLDAVSKNGLIGLAMALRDRQQTSTVIAMAAAAREKMPDMGKVGGKGYWVEGGTAV